MLAYRSSEAGLTAFLLWAETHDMMPTEEMLQLGIERGWFTPEEVDVNEMKHLRAVVALHREEAAGAHRRLRDLEASLLTIASQEVPEGMKAWQYAQLALWGPLCYWCRGFGHPGAWHGCTCREDEPWD